MAGPHIFPTNVASAIPFNNATNGFSALNVQGAIEEARSFVSTPSLDQNYWVTKQGNDTTGNGSVGQPYLTIAKALSVILDSAPTKRYTINVGPGDYNENLSLKANVFIKGAGPISTRLTGSTLNINDATWNVTSADNRSGFQDMSVNPTCTWDFSAQTNNTDGKLYFYNTRTSGNWTATANNAINQIIVRDTDFFGSWTQNGINAFISNSTWQSGAINVNSSAAVGIPATLTIVGGRITGNITATWTSNSGVTVNLAGINIGNTTILTASGTSCIVNANDGSLPVPSNRSISGGASLNRINDDYARGLLAGGGATSIDTISASAPLVGQILTATSSTTATWQYASSGATLADFGDGSDGDVTISSGTTTLTRTMYYNNLTISGTGVLNTNGYKVYVKGTLTNSVTGGIIRTPNNGGNSAGTTAGAGATAMTENDMGAGLAGQAGVAGAAGGLGGSAGNPGNAAGSAEGYGAAGANGGNGGSGTGGAAGTYTNVPERVIRHDHWYKLDYKNGGQGGASGGGGASAALGTGGGSGGGGSGGGVIIIFANTVNNTGSFSCRGGNGGNGNQGNGNSTGGGGGGGGGGGHIYIICNVLTAVSTLTVTGGTGGTGGAASGSGSAGTAGATGSTGHTTVYTSSTNTWTVT